MGESTNTYATLRFDRRIRLISPTTLLEECRSVGLGLRLRSFSVRIDGAAVPPIP